MRIDRLLLRLAFVSAVWLSVGCSGSATVDYVSLDPKEIDPPPATALRFDAGECYWWVDETTNELCVSMRCVKRNLLLGKYGRTEVLTSWVLDDPPAGSGRNYTIGPRETLTVFHTAFQSTVVGSFAGIVGLLVDDENNIHGSFRIWTKPRTNRLTLSLIPQNTNPYLSFGTFKAVKNAEQGKAIRAEVERLGGVRAPRLRTASPTTRPAATQPIPSPAITTSKPTT